MSTLQVFKIPELMFFLLVSERIPPKLTVKYGDPKLVYEIEHTSFQRDTVGRKCITQVTFLLGVSVEICNFMEKTFFGKPCGFEPWGKTTTLEWGDCNEKKLKDNIKEMLEKCLPGNDSHKDRNGRNRYQSERELISPTQHQFYNMKNTVARYFLENCLGSGIPCRYSETGMQFSLTIFDTAMNPIWERIIEPRESSSERESSLVSTRMVDECFFTRVVTVSSVWREIIVAHGA